MRRKRTGFTIVELLAALGIIALMVGLLIPALSMVRRTAKEVKQKAQFTTIELALTAFKNDYGDYPPSTIGTGTSYCGAQTLAEALLGWDLLGFHPKSAWRADGYDGLTPNGQWTYDPDRVRDDNNDGIPDSFDERKGPYLELATANAFRVGDLFSPNSTALLEPFPFVICDVFGIKEITVARGVDPVTGERVTITEKAGTPILYYKANTSKKTIDYRAPSDSIYNVYDNHSLLSLGKITNGKPHRLSNHTVFYGIPADNPPKIGYIQDPKVARLWPYRPSSYILISAGADGLYGTGDDIRNFGN